MFGRIFGRDKDDQDQAVCAECGRTLLAGEWTQTVVGADGEELVICSLCGQSRDFGDEAPAAVSAPTPANNGRVRETRTEVPRDARGESDAFWKALKDKDAEIERLQHQLARSEAEKQELAGRLARMDASDEGAAAYAPGVASMAAAALPAIPLIPAPGPVVNDLTGDSSEPGERTWARRRRSSPPNSLGCARRRPPFKPLRTRRQRTRRLPQRQPTRRSPPGRTARSTMPRPDLSPRRRLLSSPARRRRPSSSRTRRRSRPKSPPSPPPSSVSSGTRRRHSPLPAARRQRARRPPPGHPRPSSRRRPHRSRFFNEASTCSTSAVCRARSPRQTSSSVCPRSTSASTGRPSPSPSCGRWAGTASTSTSTAATWAWTSAATKSWSHLQPNDSRACRRHGAARACADQPRRRSTAARAAAAAGAAGRGARTGASPRLPGWRRRSRPRSSASRCSGSAATTRRRRGSRRRRGISTGTDEAAAD